jgi:hypothetical protein
VNETARALPPPLWGREGWDLLAVVKGNERVLSPLGCGLWLPLLSHQDSAVLAPSTAQERGASLRCAPFGVTSAARGALPGGRSGRRDGRRGRTKGCSGGRERCGLVVGIVEGLLSKHGAGHGQQSISNGSQRASMGLAALAQRGVALPGFRIGLHGHAGPVIDGLAREARCRPSGAPPVALCRCGG